MSSGFQSRTEGFCTLPLRRQRVQTQTFRTEPSISARTRCRLGDQVLLVTLWAWLMLRPVIVFLPQIAHSLAIASLISRKGADGSRFHRRVQEGVE